MTGRDALTAERASCPHTEEVYFRPRTFLYQQCLNCGRVIRSNEMSQYNNELTIRVTCFDDPDENEEATDKILSVLSNAEEEGELDFAFDVIRNNYPR
jgi:hypothetical protein